LVVLDAENLGIKPEVDFIEDVDILAYEKWLISRVLDFHEWLFYS
jgi:hypothetical protein